ncbi:uncharacterized protein LOC129772995 [Toxorhynchites rutilus septentrionalis]|uniref:uncharacterized protein LOC129772995 n=1 Tax=Toxorhynchites rutilus septentrionalis TaxID=329112 RepID=UPI00247B0771|nr:uncharacterized protein LOC129772995 [Toxorhynchites rutilus septentrionalis]
MDELDTSGFAELRDKNEIIRKYMEHLGQLRSLADRRGQISESEFNNYLIRHYFHNNNIINYIFDKNTSRILLKTVIERKKKIINFIFVLLTLFIVFSYKHEVSTVVLRNIQSFIYPGMRVWRKVAVPIIANYPSLTEYYDESCLLTNPYFQVENLNCDPCADVANVLDLTNVEHVTVNYPYIFKAQKEQVDIGQLQALFEQHRAIFTKDAFKIQSTHVDVRNLDDLFRHLTNNTQQIESHSVWRCNRMAPARLLRTVFPRPARLPATGVSLERYLIVDTAQAPPYRIPDAECANMFVIQGHGSRTFLLRPTQECRHRCRTLSVRLPASYGLIYNWWYWKPISLPEQYAKTPSVSYIGSYC